MKNKCQRRRTDYEKPGQKWGIKKTTLVDDQVRAAVEVMAEKSHSHKGCPHLVPDNQQCLSSGRKCCCVCIFSIRFVSVYILILLCPVSRHFETRAFRSDYNALDCPRFN